MDGAGRGVHSSAELSRDPEQGLSGFVHDGLGFVHRALENDSELGHAADGVASDGDPVQRGEAFERGGVEGKLLVFHQADPGVVGMVLGAALAVGIELGKNVPNHGAFSAPPRELVDELRSIIMAGSGMWECDHG